LSSMTESWCWSARPSAANRGLPHRTPAGRSRPAGTRASLGGARVCAAAAARSRPRASR
jgi:hypothetical protein